MPHISLVWRRRGGITLRGRQEGGTAVAVSAHQKTALVEGRAAARSVSLWSVMSALLLKIAQEKTTGGSYRGETRHAE